MAGDREDLGDRREQGTWVPPAMDSTRPSIARVYDYWLGGKDNYAVDREVAERILQITPEAREVGQANRRFLVEAVQSMAQAGIRQFVDLGAGIPTSPSVHETARTVHPDASVVYVDNDPVVLAHGRALVESEPGVAVLDHDLHEPAAVLADPRLQALLDLSQPVGVLMIAVLHFVEVSAAPPIIARYLHGFAPGSRLAISAASSDGADADAVARTQQAYSAGSLVFRTRTEFEALFDRLELTQLVTELQRFSTGVALGGIAVKR